MRMDPDSGARPRDTHIPAPRDLRFPFAEGPTGGGPVPRRWFKGSSLLSQAVNGVNLLFPAGERYFVRSVNHYRAVFRADPELHARVKGFAGQEARHGGEHERFNQTLAAQGFDLSGFMHVYEKRLYALVEPRLSPALNLAQTAALEHYTAALAELVFTTPLLDDVEPVMQDLLRWHAAEEIEHKSVAFDVMAAAKIPYATRMLGLGGATLNLFGCWFVAAANLWAQDRAMDRAASQARRSARAEARTLFHVLYGCRVAPAMVAAVLDYSRPGFHPSDRDTLTLAMNYLASLDTGSRGADPALG